MAVIPYEFWRKMAIPAMAFTVLILVAVLVLGRRSEFGGQRTFTGASFQPSELAKLGVAIYVSAWVAARGRHVADFKQGFFPFAVIIGLVAGLIVLEQSVSMTIIVLAIGLTIYFVGGGAFKQLVLLAVIGAPILLFAMRQFGYPFGRIEDWYNVWFNPSQGAAGAARDHLADPGGQWHRRRSRGVAGQGARSSGCGAISSSPTSARTSRSSACSPSLRCSAGSGIGRSASR